MSKPIPKSCTSLSLNMFGIACFFACIHTLNAHFPEMNNIVRASICFMALVIPIMAVEIFVFKVYKNASAKLSKKRSPNNVRVAIKIVGLLGTFGVLGFFYWLIPEYNHHFYNQYYSLLLYAIPTLLVVSWFYFLEVDARMEEPEDGYWHWGCVIVGRWDLVEPKIIAEHFRAWIVKGFFLPLMFTYSLGNIRGQAGFDFDRITESFIGLYDYLYPTIFTIDVAFAAIGYAMTFKFLDSHIRSVEPTFLGWFVAVMCYQPFWTAIFYGAYFSYDNSFFWGNWTSGNPMFQMLWGSAILFLIGVYSVATVCLGYRFSNLTYRGLVTNGPYRWTKHPAYVSKNLSWWFISVPFISTGDSELALRQCLLLLGVNYLYYLRARTEENHLSNYPEYVEYAEWIEKHGVFRWVGKLIPYFKYDYERTKSWNSKTWWKQMGREEYVADYTPYMHKNKN